VWKHACNICSDIVKMERLNLQRIVTGDDQFVHQYEPAGKR